MVADATAAFGWSPMGPARSPTQCKSTEFRLPDCEITKGQHSLHPLPLTQRSKHFFPCLLLKTGSCKWSWVQADTWLEPVNPSQIPLNTSNYGLWNARATKSCDQRILRSSETSTFEALKLQNIMSGWVKEKLRIYALTQNITQASNSSKKKP